MGLYMNGSYPWVGWSPPPKKCPVVLAKALDKQSKWAEGMSEKNEGDIETSEGAASGPSLIHNSWHRCWPLGLLTWSTQPLVTHEAESPSWIMEPAEVGKEMALWGVGVKKVTSF